MGSPSLCCMLDLSSHSLVVHRCIYIERERSLVAASAAFKEEGRREIANRPFLFLNDASVMHGTEQEQKEGEEEERGTSSRRWRKMVRTIAILARLIAA